MSVLFCVLQEGSGDEVKRGRGRLRQASDFKSTWQENNNAERIFNLLPERDTRCYSALIRGMVMVRTQPCLPFVRSEPAACGRLKPPGGGLWKSNGHCVNVNKGLVCLLVSPQHRAYAKAFSLYTDLLNDRMTGEAHPYYVHILGPPHNVTLVCYSS